MDRIGGLRSIESIVAELYEYSRAFCFASDLRVCSVESVGGGLYNSNKRGPFRSRSPVRSQENISLFRDRSLTKSRSDYAFKAT